MSAARGRCFDIGGATRRALERFERTGKAFPGDADPDSAGNGALMRLAPVPLFYAADAVEAAERSGQSSRTTHGAKVAVDACRHFGAVLAAAVQGADKEALLSEPWEPRPGDWQARPLHPEVEEVARGSYKRRGPPAIQGPRLRRPHAGGRPVGVPPVGFVSAGVPAGREPGP